ncbi:50S ribosomal protein L24 [Microlunatus soli]|uniref:Large ribosomal subunit protein uL24 n=1 Tax=Microlunatus soli TaxID=630515 RepID=A0A1H1WPA5_9ACTN|nr:50S ribosomal protein L24 [Microlunatus soli]SDS98196.1 LSU ribosomal protein L24P [Microlunatus soli]
MASNKINAAVSRQHGKIDIRKGDRVKVLSGKDKGTVGEVLAVQPDRERVTVSGVNIVKRHLKDSSATPQGSQQTQGGIVSSEAPIHVSNVGLVVKDGDGNEVTTRIAHRRDEVTKRRPDGTEYTAYRSVRIARKTGEEI